MALFSLQCQQQNEAFFHEFVASLEGGVVGTCAYALQECVRPEVKVTKSALLGSVIRLGDVDVRQDEAVEIVVKMSKCTAVVRPPPLKKFAMRVRPDEAEKVDINDTMDVDDDGDRKDTYVELKTRTEYFVDHGTRDAQPGAKQSSKPHHGTGDDTETEDDDIPVETDAQVKTDGREKIDQEQLVRGFKYGSTYVPCPEGQFPRLNTRKGIDICGFFPDKNVCTSSAVMVWRV